MKILVIDNYDSFTFNLVQLLSKGKNKIVVKRNDDISVEEIDNIHPDKILLSPGAGRPENSGVCLDIIEKLKKTVPVLGVCLGMQVIGYKFGARVIKAKDIYHGKTSTIKNDGKTIFKNVQTQFNAMRYHSLVLSRRTIPKELEISAETEDGTVMGIRHRNFPLEGIQFHPESILTPYGKKIINNWLQS
jgi:anthranilate synthase/aminodeoxychorismate synthase-like glutamine amidotransferase